MDNIDNWEIYKSYLYFKKPKSWKFISCELFKLAAHIDIAHRLWGIFDFMQSAILR